MRVNIGGRVVNVDLDEFNDRSSEHKAAFGDALRAALACVSGINSHTLRPGDRYDGVMKFATILQYRNMNARLSSPASKLAVFVMVDESVIVSDEAAIIDALRERSKSWNSRDDVPQIHEVFRNHLTDSGDDFYIERRNITIHRDFDTGSFVVDWHDNAEDDRILREFGIAEKELESLEADESADPDDDDDSTDDYLPKPSVN